MQPFQCNIEYLTMWNETCMVMQILVHGIKMVFLWHCINCLHGIVATRPKRQVAEAGLLVWTCTVTVFSTTCAWSVVCKVDLKRTRWGWHCDHRGCPCCDCRWFRCINTCQEMINVHTQSQLALANYPHHTKISYEEWSLTLTRQSTRP